MQGHSDLENEVLRRFYVARNNDHAMPLPVAEDASSTEIAEVAEACRELAAKGLIDWTQIFGATVGFGRITAAGIIVVDHETHAFEFERKPQPAPLDQLWRRAAALLLSRHRTHYA